MYNRQPIVRHCGVVMGYLLRVRRLIYFIVVLYDIHWIEPCYNEISLHISSYCLTKRKCRTDSRWCSFQYTDSYHYIDSYQYRPHTPIVKIRPYPLYNPIRRSLYWNGTRDITESVRDSGSTWIVEPNSWAVAEWVIASKLISNSNLVKYHLLIKLHLSNHFGISSRHGNDIVLFCGKFKNIRAIAMDVMDKTVSWGFDSRLVWSGFPIYSSQGSNSI